MQLNAIDSDLKVFGISIFCLIIHQTIILFLPSGRNKKLKADSLIRFRLSFVMERLTGLITLGALPFSLLLLEDFEIKNFIGFGDTFLWPGFLVIIITVLLTLIFTKLVSSRIDLSNGQLTVKNPAVSNNWVIVHSIVWGLYLFSYELLLRGFLFFSSLELFGIVYAIIINCTIYSIIHIPKGRSEALGAIPFGIILCLITFQTKSIWGAYILHMSLAISMDWRIVKRINKAVELKM